MTGLQFAVSVGFGLVGLSIYFCGRHLLNVEKKMKKERQWTQERKAAEDAKREEAVKDLEVRIDVALAVGVPASSGFVALVQTQKDLEAVYYKWLSEQHNLFYATCEDRILVTGISNGSFKYTLPESIRKFKRK